MEVPVLKVGSSLTHGFSEEPWHSALDVAGYPRSAGAPPPPARPTQKPEVPPPAAPESTAEAPAETPSQEAPPAEPPPARRGTYPVYND
jgi:hypothetical protein